MATGTLYASASISGNAATPANAIGAPNGVWTGNTGNNAWTHRWRIESVPQDYTLTGVQTFSVVMRKSPNSGNNPTLSTISVYSGGTLVYNSSVNYSVSTQGQTYTSPAIDASLFTNTSDIQIELAVSTSGGNPNSRTTIQVDSIGMNIEYSDSPTIPPVNYPISGITRSTSGVSGVFKTPLKLTPGDVVETNYFTDPNATGSHATFFSFNNTISIQDGNFHIVKSSSGSHSAHLSVYEMEPNQLFYISMLGAGDAAGTLEIDVLGSGVRTNAFNAYVFGEMVFGPYSASSTGSATISIDVRSIMYPGDAFIMRDISISGNAPAEEHFSGDTPATDTYTYRWVGEANASASQKIYWPAGQTEPTAHPVVGLVSSATQANGLISRRSAVSGTGVSSASTVSGAVGHVPGSVNHFVFGAAPSLTGIVGTVIRKTSAVGLAASTTAISGLIASIGHSVSGTSQVTSSSVGNIGKRMTVSGAGVTSSSTVSGTVTHNVSAVDHGISGLVAAVTSTYSTVGRRMPLASARIDSSSTVSGAATHNISAVNYSVSGSITAVTSTSSTVGKRMSVAGTRIDSESTALGSATHNVSAVNHDVYGSITAVALSSSTVGRRMPIPGTRIDSESTVSGSVTHNISAVDYSVSGAVAAVTSISSTVGKRQEIAGASASTSSTSAFIRSTTHSVSGKAPGLSSASGEVGLILGTVDYAAAGTAAANSATSGTAKKISSVSGLAVAQAFIYGAANAVHPIVGKVDSVTQTTGAVTLSKTAEGPVNSISTASGTVSYRANVFGNITVFSTVVGTMGSERQHIVTGTVASATTAKGNASARLDVSAIIIDTLPEVPEESDANISISELIGEVAANLRAAGIVGSTVIVSGTPVLGKPVDGTAAGASIVGGEIEPIARSLAGMVQGASRVRGGIIITDGTIIQVWSGREWVTGELFIFRDGQWQGAEVQQYTSGQWVALSGL